MVVLFFAVVVHYAGVYVYMYIHVHRAVLDQGFVYLFSSFVPHCHQLSIVGDKDSEFEIARQICMHMCTYNVHVLYIGLSWTRVLSTSFLVLSPTVISYP